METLTANASRRDQDPPPCILEQQNVLVVEDNPEVSKLTREWIIQTGLYRVVWAETVEQALGVFVPGKFFVVLLDLHLGISIEEGINLACRFREQDDNVLIAVITAYYPLFNDQLLTAIDDFIPEPVDLHLLESKLLMWAIKYARRKALKIYVDDRVHSYKMSLEEIRGEEKSLREQLHSLLMRFEIGGTNGQSD